MDVTGLQFAFFYPLIWWDVFFTGSAEAFTYVECLYEFFLKYGEFKCITFILVKSVCFAACWKNTCTTNVTQMKHVYSCQPAHTPQNSVTAADGYFTRNDYFLFKTRL